MTKSIYMGQMDTVRTPDTLKTTLGSCVGLVLYDPKTDVFGMAHIMLPKSESTTTAAQAGKYADTAIPALIAKMLTPASEAKRLRAKVAGGANMFPNIAIQKNTEALQVGNQNIESTLEIIKSMGIVILGSDLGGTQGRELSIDAQSGKVWVRSIGAEPKEL